MEHIKKLGSQTVVYGLSSIVPRFLNFLLTPLYTYKLSAPAYGDVVILYAYVSFINIILTYGLETGFFFFANKEEKFSKVYGSAFLSILVSTSLFLLLSFLFLNDIAGFLNYGNNVRYIFWFILILGVDSLTAIPFAKLRQQNKAFRFALIKLLNVVVTILFNVLLILVIPAYLGPKGQLFGKDYKLDVELIFIANLIGSLFTLVMLIPDIFSAKLSFSWKIWGKMINYSYPLMFAGLAGIVNETLDRILLQYLLPSQFDIKAEIGIYGACAKVAVLMTIFIQMFRFAAEPYFFNKLKSPDQKLILADVTKYFVIYGLLIFLGVMAYIDVIQFFIGPEFREGIAVVPVYMFALFGLGVYFNLSFWYKLSGKTYFGLLITCLGACITIFFNILLIPKLGYMGAAIVHLLCYLVMNIISYFLGQKFYPVNYPVRTIGNYVLITLVLFFICYYLRLSSITMNLIKNTLIVGAFIFYLEKKERIITIFIKK